MRYILRVRVKSYASISMCMMCVSVRVKRSEVSHRAGATLSLFMLSKLNNAPSLVNELCDDDNNQFCVLCYVHYPSATYQHISYMLTQSNYIEEL